MSAFSVFPIDVKQGIYWVEERGRKVTCDVRAGTCGCHTCKLTRSCRHLDAMRRYCKRHGLTFGPTDICPACDGITGLPVPCGVCAGRGRLPAVEARALRQSRWGGRTEAENIALLRLWGEKTERDVPLTRRRFRAADDEAQAA